VIDEPLHMFWRRIGQDAVTEIEDEWSLPQGGHDALNATL
jgi:hypothetical protein